MHNAAGAIAESPTGASPARRILIASLLSGCSQGLAQVIKEPK